MSPMMIVVGLALALIIGGLLIAWLSPSAGKASVMFWWVGVILAVLGLILLLAPLFVFLADVIHRALGVNR